MIEEALLITYNKGLILLANKVALELFGKNIAGRAIVEVIEDLDLCKIISKPNGGRAGWPYVGAWPKEISLAVDPD